MNKLKSSIEKIKPEVFFGCFASFFGLVLLFITPPFQVPDEINHFYRAYQIADGGFISEKVNQRIGGNIPTSVIECTGKFNRIFWNVHTKTNYATIAEQFNILLDKSKTAFVDFPNTGVYSPVSYIPQATGIYLLKLFDLPAIYLFYGARLISLLFWIVGIFYAIRLIPLYKWLLTLTALLPMSLYINMSISADVVTNILSYLLIAHILNLAFKDQPISFKKISIAAILTVLLASAKLVYAPIVLLFLLIPETNFRSKKEQYLQTIILFALTAISVIYWSESMSALYTPYSLYNPLFRDSITLVSCANMHEQMQYILSHGMYIIEVFLHSMASSFDMYFEGSIGTFGWLETKLPLWIIWLAYGVLILVAINQKNRTVKLNIYHKFIIVSVLIIVLILILLSQHLTWDCVGGDVITTIQGRYFIPVFPLLFFLLYTTKNKFISNISAVVILFSLLSVSISIYTIYKRYYINTTPLSTTIHCGAESVSKENLFTTNNPSILLDNITTQSKEHVRSGEYAIKLTSKNPFGFTYQLYNCKYGDRICAKVWRYEKAGTIAISGEDNAFFVGESKASMKDSLGWELLELNYTITKNMEGKQTNVFVLHTTSDASYFDDFSVTYTAFE